MSLPRLLCLLSIAPVLWAGGARATPAEEASTRVEGGATVEAVEKAIGFRPTIVEQKTCGGTDTVLPWPCRVQTYADGRRTLLIYFAKSDTASPWRVQSWYVQ